MKLTDEEKSEMIEDAKNISRSRVFKAARMITQQGSLDDYIDFLSQNIEWVKVVPTLLRRCYPDAIWIDLLKAEEFRRYLKHPEWLRQEILPAREFATKLWQGQIF